ncbi:Oligopeptide transport ATP-binding protein OppD [bioreactor metagenome]|uniref:Oligopeptide transport ATP-binding protein OppD n=1 Tax=bioreactor metagenome TaxID=1076179 RepID=A0A645C9F3_9ZZZZ
MTIQAQILDLLRTLKERMRVAVLLITHDLGVVAEMADLVVVMYAGRVVEKGTAEEILLQPAHPYTAGLMASRPVIGRGGGRLSSIPGVVPNPACLPPHCYFYERCARRMPACEQGDPAGRFLSPTHWVSCYLYREQSGGI